MYRKSPSVSARALRRERVDDDALNCHAIRRQKVRHAPENRDRYGESDHPSEPVGNVRTKGDECRIGDEAVGPVLVSRLPVRNRLAQKSGFRHPFSGFPDIRDDEGEEDRSLVPSRHGADDAAGEEVLERPQIEHRNLFVAEEKRGGDALARTEVHAPEDEDQRRENPALRGF